MGFIIRFNTREGWFQSNWDNELGIANSLGFADGELIDFGRHLAIIKNMVDNVKIPVSADIEAGYSDDVDTITANVLRTADIGVAGINIEDSLKNEKGLRDITKHGELLTKIRSALDNHGYKDFYINARTDTYFHKEKPLVETLERANVYIESGASGIFVPGVTNHKEIQEIAAHTDGPLNVFALPGLTYCTKLKELGVKRFSFGNALSDKVIVFMEANAQAILEAKDTALLYEN